MCSEGKQLPKQKTPYLLQSNTYRCQVQCLLGVWVEKRGRTCLILAELGCNVNDISFYLLFTCFTWKDTKMIHTLIFFLSLSLCIFLILPELSESHTQSQMDKWINFGAHTAETSLFPLLYHFCRGMFVEKIGFTVCIQQYIQLVAVCAGPINS